MKKIIILQAILGTLLCVLGISTFAADGYPNRYITIIVPNAAGGPTDLIARSIGQSLSSRLGQPVVIDNRAGAGGIVAAEAVARAKPDGYTLLLATTNTQAIVPGIYGVKLRYDPAKSFVPIGLIATAANVLVVRNSLPVKSVADLIALAKRDPDKLMFSSTGIGSSAHLTMELFTAMTGTQMRHVPYKAAGAATMDLYEGRVDLAFAPADYAFKELIRSGKTKALMVSSAERSPLFPEIPTAQEAGLRGYDISIWYGLNAPAGTPQPIVERLNKELNSILATAEVTKKLYGDGEVARPMSPAEYEAFASKDRQRWIPIIKTAGVKAE